MLQQKMLDSSEEKELEQNMEDTIHDLGFSDSDVEEFMEEASVADHDMEEFFEQLESKLKDLNPKGELRRRMRKILQT